MERLKLFFLLGGIILIFFRLFESFLFSSALGSCSTGWASLKVR